MAFWKDSCGWVVLMNHAGGHIYNSHSLLFANFAFQSHPNIAMKFLVRCWVQVQLRGVCFGPRSSSAHVI